MAEGTFLHSLSVALAETDTVPDSELLRRFAESADAVAFELLLRRHAQVVWSVCRSQHPTDFQAAEDAFQVTFVALARKAGSLREPSAAGWLFRVAQNAARRVKKQKHTPLPESASSQPSQDSAELAEVAKIVSEEVQRLAEKFREPVLLCFYEGCSHTQAAERLGWPVGTLASRLARAKERLRDRLLRRGVAVPAAGLAGLIGSATPASAFQHALSEVLTPTTDTVQKLTTEVLHSMVLTKIKIALASVLVAVLLVGGLGKLLTLAANGSDPKAQVKGERPKPDEDMKNILGLWKPIKMVTKDGDTPEEELKGTTCEITKDTMKFRMTQEGESDDLNYTLDASQTPKHIECKALKGPDAVRGVAMPGIYELKGDDLKICIRLAEKAKDGRPKDFSAEKGGTTALLILKRIKPDEKKEDKDKAALEAEVKKFAGTWKPISIENDRGKAPADELKNMRWEIQGTTILSKDNDADPGTAIVFKLDLSKTPHHIDMTGKAPGPFEGKTSKGVYEFKDGKLRISLSEPGEERVTEFKVVDKKGGVIELEKVEAKAEKEKVMQEELKKFTGTWQVTKLEVSKQQLAAEAIRQMVYTFKNETFEMKSGPKEKAWKGEIKIDPSTSPKQIDVTTDSPDGIKTSKGIYEFKLGKLRLCVADSVRPTEFKVPDEKGMLLEFEFVVAK